MVSIATQAQAFSVSSQPHLICALERLICPLFWQTSVWMQSALQGAFTVAIFT